MVSKTNFFILLFRIFIITHYCIYRYKKMLINPYKYQQKLDFLFYDILSIILGKSQFVCKPLKTLGKSRVLNVVLNQDKSNIYFFPYYGRKQSPSNHCKQCFSVISTKHNSVIFISLYSITVYIDTRNCHLTLIKHRQIKVYASVTYCFLIVVILSPYYTD